MFSPVPIPEFSIHSVIGRHTVGGEMCFDGDRISPDRVRRFRSANSRKQSIRCSGSRKLTVFCLCRSAFFLDGEGMSEVVRFRTM